MTAKERIGEVIRLLPKRIAEPFWRMEENTLVLINEIRLRVDHAIAITVKDRDYFIALDGGWESLPGDGITLSSEDIRDAFMSLCRHSVYAYEDELKNGYFTLPGGNRVGVGGHTAIEHGRILSMGAYSSLCIRIAQEVIGCADFALAYLYSGLEVHSSLILSPPMMGKTTILRDMARQISDGIFGARGKRVCIVDERSEIAACSFGVPQMDVGCRTDVLDGCPKALGIEMALRSLSPQVIITDELGGRGDTDAVLMAKFSGVAVIASAHGRNIDEILGRPDIHSMVEAEVFDRYFVLGERPGTVKEVFDRDLNLLYGKDSYQ